MAEPDSPTPPKKPSAEQFLAQNKGKIVVLLLGMEGCPSTKANTKVLAKTSKDWSDGIVLARLDVAPPGKTIPALTDWPHDYFYAVDTGRIIAQRLDFFYYPTLYILDREGEVRYAGGIEVNELKTMLNEILSETPDSPKKFYTPPLPQVGTKAAGFTAQSLDGKKIDLTSFPEQGATLLFFSAVTCPFSTKLVKQLPALAKEFSKQNLSIVVIEKGTNSKSVKAFYSQLTLPGPIIPDPDGAISHLYSVEPVPFYFIIDKAGKIAARGPYVEATVQQNLQATLGLTSTQPNTQEPSGAG